MNNEIGRKITSLTLMAIMVAGGMTLAIPGIAPVAHAANANLFVSAENSQFDNYMSGPQVIEVVVIDSDINDTDEGKGEPDVTVNGKTLRMVQAVDGNWYGYFADRDQAQIADSTTSVGGEGLDFGSFCSATTAQRVLGINLSETNGVAIPSLSRADGGVNGTKTGGEITASCAGGNAHPDSKPLENNVVREPKAFNKMANVQGGKYGQIGLNNTSGSWPFIQLYALNPTGNVVVQYNKGGGVQSTTLTFDTVEKYAGLELDRSVYPRGAQVHASITDLWLNIDPTDEDSWTFGTITNGSATTNYQVFNENGISIGNTTTNTGDDLTNALGRLMCEDNCVLLFDPDVQGTGNVVTIQDNDDSNIVFSVNAGSNADDPTDFGVPVGSNRNVVLEGKIPITITEQGPNSGVFGTYDESDTSVLKVIDTANRGTSASIDYNETPVTILVGFGSAKIDIQAVDDTWTSGEAIPVVIVDSDANKNSRVDEDMDLFDPTVALIPALSTGDPFTLGEGTKAPSIIIFNSSNAAAGANPGASVGNVVGFNTAAAGNTTAATKVQPFSERLIVKDYDAHGSDRTNADIGMDKAEGMLIELDQTLKELQDSLMDTTESSGVSFNYINWDVRSTGVANKALSIYLVNSTADIIDNNKYCPGNTDACTAIPLVLGGDAQGYDLLSQGAAGVATSDGGSFNTAIFGDDAKGEDNLAILLDFTTPVDLTEGAGEEAIVVDFFSFGFTDDGVQSSERVANQIIRIEAEESGDNTGTFEGSLEYVMVNQLNIQTNDTFGDISTIADDPSFIVIEDLTDEDAPRVSYNDLGSDGAETPVSDQEEAPSHSGVVSLNQDSYKIADTVVITLEDLDLNVDSDLIDIFTVTDVAGDDAIGSDSTQSLSFGQLGRLLDVTFDDVKWSNQDDDDGKGCKTPGNNNGLKDTGFTLVETGTETGVFTGNFQIPSQWCRAADKTPETTTGLDIEVNYVDFRDKSGEIIEVGDSAGVRASTGSVSLDRTVYPVPFGIPDDFDPSNSNSPDDRSVFPIHQTGLDKDAGLGDGEYLVNGDLTVHIRVNDPDFDVNPSGEDQIKQNVPGTDLGPVKISVLRGSSTVVLGYGGGDSASDGRIHVGDEPKKNSSGVRQFGPLDEIAPDAGIFELDLTVKFTDGPADSQCPNNVSYELLDDVYADGSIDSRFANNGDNTENYCILQGDILQVEYTDPADASGDENTVTDSATFDLRNGVLQTDKSVYIIGSDMILTLIEPDFDLDNDQAETYDLDLIEWDSDAATISMGNNGGFSDAFDPEPTDIRETGDSTGIFQIVIEIPEELDNDRLERGEEIILEYTDWGPSGSDYVGDESEDVNLTVFTSNFGATVELDQKVYSWTDKVYITIVAPDHNFDSDLVDEIGDTDLDPIKVSTRGADLDNYKLVETGTDTGIFTGEVILAGFKHDADGDSTTGIDGNDVDPGSPSGNGPTDGLLPAGDDDGLTVSFEFSEDETVVGSALIRWNIGEVQWLEASYPASGTGVVRVIDPDMNLDPEAVDNFKVDVWSDSDAGGIDLTLTETNEATGIFEGTVFFTVDGDSSGHRLRVAEGDTVTAEYEDNTLPDPYTTADELDITATSLIGTVVPPLERAPAANLRTVDAFGNSLDSVSVDQQVQISADLANGQDREQSFAYLVQIQDANGVTVSLAWITGSLSAGQSFSPALSWIPTDAGTYTATAFVWESVDNPTALSPPVSTTVNVR